MKKGQKAKSGIRKAENRISDCGWGMAAAPALRGLGDGCAVGDEGVGGKWKAGGGIRKAENRISDCGLGIADGGMRSPEIGNQKQPLRSQRLSGKNGPAEQGPTEKRKLEGSVGPRSAAAKRSAAFTLIELLGVMAIIGILAAVVLPPMIARIEDAQTTNEDAKLEEIARALVKGITTEGRLPNPNLTPYAAGGWADIAYRYTTLTDDSRGPGTLHYVFPAGNAEGAEGENARRVYLDDTLMAYLASQAGSANVPFDTPRTGWLPTTAGGVAFPNQAMPLYIVSGSKRGLDLYCTPNQPGVMMNPAPQDSPAFGAPLIADLRNWVKAPEPPGSVNAGSFMVPQSIARWGSNSATMYRRGEFLHVKMVDLRPLFCRVTLVEYPTPQNALTDAAIAAGPPATHHGIGFAGGTTYLGTTAAGFTFSFVAPAAAAANPAGSFTTAPAGVAVGTGGALAGRSKSMIIRTGGGANDNGTIPAPGGGTSATFSATVSPAAPSPPWWGIVPPGVGVGNQMPTNANTETFYVIKGTSLSLYTDGAALPANPVLTVQINADTTFEYFNGSWTRVD